MPDIRDNVLKEEVGNNYNVLPTFWYDRKPDKGWEDITGPKNRTTCTEILE